jgi:hypothetical protein
LPAQSKQKDPFQRNQLKNSTDYDDELQAMLDDLTNSKARMKGNPH